MKGIAQKFIVKVFHMPPMKRITNSAFRNETMNMRIPFKISAKCMKDADEARSEALGFIDIMKHTSNNTVNCRKKATEEGTISKEKRT